MVCFGRCRFLLVSISFLSAVSGESSRRQRRCKVDSELQSSLSDKWIQENKILANPEACPCSDVTQCRTISGPPIRTKEVFGFINNNDTSFFNWTRISTVAWASSDQVMCNAHLHGARAILASPSFNLTELASDENARRAWVQEALYMVQTRYRDGLVFDYESPLESSSVEAQAYAELVQQTTRVFHDANPSLQVTVCVAWSPDGIDGRNYRYKELADASDALYVMDYDTQSQIYQACIASANAPYFGMVHGIQQYLALGIDPSKLILGVPWYGYRYPCLAGAAPDARYCPIEPIPFRGVNCSDAAGREVAFLTIKQTLKESQVELRRDTYMDAPFFNTVENQTVIQYWFDDAESLRNKYAWARSAGLAGIGPYSFDDLNPNLYPQNAFRYSDEIWGSFDSFFDKVETSIL